MIGRQVSEVVRKSSGSEEISSVRRRRARLLLVQRSWRQLLGSSVRPLLGAEAVELATRTDVDVAVVKSRSGVDSAVELGQRRRLQRSVSRYDGEATGARGEVDLSVSGDGAKRKSCPRLPRSCRASALRHCSV